MADLAVYEFAQPPMHYTGGFDDPEQEADLSHVPETFQEVAARVEAAFDAASCDGGCGATVGWVLYEDDDGRAGGRWHTAWFMDLPEVGIVALCDDCVPDDDAPAPAVTTTGGTP